MMTAENLQVHLTYDEMLHAGTVGVKYVLDNIAEGREPQYGGDRYGLGELFQGLTGEYGVANWAGVPWSGSVGNIRADDVARLQVRSTSHPDGFLIVQPRDRPDRPFILVIEKLPLIELKGWIMGRDAKQADFLKTLKRGNQAYCVPQERLRPMSELDPRWLSS